MAQPTVTVFNAGSTGLAAIYADNNGTALANPFTGNVDGTFAFYGQNARYDLTATKAGYSFSTTLGRDQLLYDISTACTPVALAANVNNYTPVDATTGLSFLLGGILRVSASVAVDVTGLAAGTNGQPMRVWNVGTFTITLKHQSANSAAANRFICPSATDLPLAANESAYLDYDLTATRWRVSTTSVTTVSSATLGSGVADATTFLRGDRTWTAASANLVTFFESADQAVTADFVLNVPHSLGVKPKLVQVTLKNATTQANWAVGDEVLMDVGSNVTGTANGVTVGFDATNVTVITTVNLPQVKDKVARTDTIITAANWRWVVRAWK